MTRINPTWDPANADVRFSATATIARTIDRTAPQRKSLRGCSAPGPGPTQPAPYSGAAQTHDNTGTKQTPLPFIHPACAQAIVERPSAVRIRTAANLPWRSTGKVRRRSGGAWLPTTPDRGLHRHRLRPGVAACHSTIWATAEQIPDHPAPLPTVIA